MKKEAWKFLAGTTLSLSLLVAGCSGGSKESSNGGTTSTGKNSSTAQSSGGKTLIIAMGADNTGLDPETVMNNESGYIMSAIYNQLVEYKPGTTEVGPGLAEKWEISEDGKTYTFHLRKGVKFQDGTPCDAEAVVQWLDRLLNKQNPNYYANRKGIDSFVDFTFPGVDSYKKLDDSTVQIHMTKPNGGFLNSLAMVWTGVTSPAAVKQWGEEFYKHPVGTGPYKFVEWVPNDHVTLEVNPDYWGEKPKIDKIIFRDIPESSVRLLELKKGTIDVIANVSPNDVDVLKGDKNVEILQQPGLMVNGIGLPTEVKPFNDVRVRQALNYAIDKESLNQYLYKGLATTMNSAVPPVQWSYDSSLKPYPYDLAKAKQLLADAGYPNGFDATLYVYPQPRSYNPVGGPELGQKIQADLKQIGININIQQLEWGAYIAKVRTKEFKDMSLTGWSGDNGDPDNFLDALWGTNNIPSINASHYSNKKLDDLLAKARESANHDERVKLYTEGQKIVMEEAPWIFLNYATQLRATTSKVHGMVLSPTSMFFGLDKVTKD